MEFSRLSRNIEQFLHFPLLSSLDVLFPRVFVDIFRDIQLTFLTISGNVVQLGLLG